MNITTIFKATVKTINFSNNSLENSVTVQKQPLKSKKKSSFSLKTEEIVKQITKLHKSLLDNRSAYLNVSHYLTKNQVHQGEIHANVENLIEDYYRSISDLENVVESTKTNSQSKEHHQVICVLLRDYLKSVQNVYLEQKAIRAKRSLELKKISKLQSVTKPAVASDILDRSSNSLKVLEINGDENSISLDEEDHLSPEDIQILEEENEQLRNELNSLSEEAQKVGSKIANISELQKVINENVMEQDKQTESLLSSVVGNTEDVQQGNEAIRQAIQRKAGMRVWVLFVVLVLSFTLLFLDWYNP